MQGYRRAEQFKRNEHEHSYFNPGRGRRRNPLTLQMRDRRAVRVHAYKGGKLFVPYRREWPNEDSIRAYSTLQARRIVRAHSSARWDKRANVNPSRRRRR